MHLKLEMVVVKVTNTTCVAEAQLLTNQFRFTSVTAKSYSKKYKTSTAKDTPH